ncbi:MAG TPA: phosphate butyryltransferase [Bacillota bacterium]|nr:phosphate butyryltransferase [Bacillota bacterium]HOA15559.1 phosphate butyryltransferase [Bacillota bacterium]HOG53137.1 phosphate butyryltransferase [Bacillota bacterium]
MFNSFDQIISEAKSGARQRIAIAAANDADVLEAVKLARDIDLADFSLFGDGVSIGELAKKVGLSLDGVEIVDEPGLQLSALKAVQHVSSGKAGTLMKGLIGTTDFLRAVLDKEVGLRTGSLISHVAVIKSPKFDRFFYLTDGAMNIAPSLDQKIQIINNAVRVAHALGNENPKVACIAAVETVNPDMPATIDASLLAKMSDRRQIKGCVVDGPFGLDNAVSQESARHKGVSGPVAGQADILMCPEIVTGNVIYKALSYFADVECGAVISGARAPIVLTSRADSPRTKLLSMATAVAVAKNS